MILQSTASVIKYSGSQPLNLMVAPSPDAGGNIYRDYFNFVQNIDFIYATQDSQTYNIPIFSTVYDSLTDSNIPNPNSTLHFLVPEQEYYIKVKSETVLPIKIPITIGLVDFISQETRSAQEDKKLCIPQISLNSTSVSLSSTNTHYISVFIRNAKSNERFYYEFSPVFSNWPANLSPISGFLTVVAEPGQTTASGAIESTFFYSKKLFDDIDSIPYVKNKNIGSSYYTNNIFTILNLKIFDTTSDCVLFNDNINIFCRSCVDQYGCPSIDLRSSGGGAVRYITADIKDLQPNTEYTYEFKTESSNCPANISPISGIVHSDRNSQIKTIYGVFRFCENNLNCNLPSTNVFTDPLIAKNIFQNISLNLKTTDETLCPVTTASALISCNDCFESSNFNTAIRFSLPLVSEGGTTVRNRTFYPYPLVENISYDLFDATQLRPEIEHVINNGSAAVSSFSDNLLVPCCEKTIPLQLEVTGAIPGDKYLYDITSYPEIQIVPNTGIISFGETSGNFSISVNPRGQISSSIHVILTHEKSNKQASDATIVSCVPTGVFNAATLAANYVGGWFNNP